MFSGGVYVGKHTPQAASVRAKASARSGLHPLEKMLAFSRSVSKFFDTLAALMGGSLVVLGLNVGGCSAGTAYPMGAFVVLAARAACPAGAPLSFP